MAIPWTAGDVVRKLRKEKGWSVRDLSEASGVGRMTISSVERGESVTAHTLTQLAAALNTTVEVLRDPGNPLADFAERFARLSPRHQANVAALIDSLLDDEES